MKHDRYFPELLRTKAIFLLTSAVLVLNLDQGRADVSSTQYRGQSIVPIKAAGIRMVSAKVDIECGEPGDLSAVFVMDNEESSVTEVQLGFPVSIPGSAWGSPSTNYDVGFKISFDDIPVGRASIQEATPDDHMYGADRWFYCQHRFPPGRTIVKVSTKLPASAAYHHPYAESLSYCIQSGAGWKGRIGSEEVTIHFPVPIAPEEIIFGEPASGKVEGNTVRWRFEDFEPKHNDHDIFLEFFDPDVLPTLAKVRARSVAKPDDSQRMLALIRHLLALQEPRFGFPYPPENMTRKEYREILTMLKSDHDRARFQTLFVCGPAGRYHSRNRNWNEHADEVTTMLSAVDYVEPECRSVFLIEGRYLLNRFLKEHPHNSEAWSIYLEEMFAPVVEFNVYPYQIERLKTAVENCPGDPTIRLWAEVSQWERQKALRENPEMTPHDDQMREKWRRLKKHIETHGIFAVRYKPYDSKFE